MVPHQHNKTSQYSQRQFVTRSNKRLWFFCHTFNTLDRFSLGNVCLIQINFFFHLPPLSHPSGDGLDCISIFKGMRTAIHRKRSLWELFKIVTSKYDAPSCANYKIKQVKQHVCMVVALIIFENSEAMNCVNGLIQRSMVSIFKLLAVLNLKTVYAVWDHFPIQTDYSNSFVSHGYIAYKLINLNKIISK